MPKAGVFRRAGVFLKESNTETTAKRARVEPRTEEIFTIRMLFQNFLSLKLLLNDTTSCSSGNPVEGSLPFSQWTLIPKPQLSGSAWGPRTHLNHVKDFLNAKTIYKSLPSSGNSLGLCINASNAVKMSDCWCHGKVYKFYWFP